MKVTIEDLRQILNELEGMDSEPGMALVRIIELRDGRMAQAHGECHDSGVELRMVRAAA